MKKIYNYWLPDTDNHFERLIKKRIKNGGPAEYQDDVRNAAYQYVKDFDVAVDIGANVGFWSKPLASKFNRVIAFEPLEQVYSCLEENTKGLPVDIHKYAIGSKNSFIKMTYDQNNTGNSFVSHEGSGPIKVKRLDDLDLPKFGLLKIDCERYELEVLKGAEKTILKYKPVIICEQHKDTNYVAGKFLKKLGAKAITNVRRDYIFGWK
jgi:FkbM family methyltransferase